VDAASACRVRPHRRSMRRAEDPRCQPHQRTGRAEKEAVHTRRCAGQREDESHQDPGRSIQRRARVRCTRRAMAEAAIGMDPSAALRLPAPATRRSAARTQRRECVRLVFDIFTRLPPSSAHSSNCRSPRASTKRGTFPSQIVRASYDEWSQDRAMLRGVRRWTPQRGDAMRVHRCAQPTLAMQNRCCSTVASMARHAFFGSRKGAAWLAMQPFDSANRCGRIHPTRRPDTPEKTKKSRGAV